MIDPHGARLRALEKNLFLNREGPKYRVHHIAHECALAVDLRNNRAGQRGPILPKKSGSTGDCAWRDELKNKHPNKLTL